MDEDRIGLRHAGARGAVATCTEYRICTALSSARAAQHSWMAIVRILATKIPSEGPQPWDVAYRAQIFERADDGAASWVCSHQHHSAARAQLCGVEFLTERRSMTRKRGVA